MTCTQCERFEAMTSHGDGEFWCMYCQASMTDQLWRQMLGANFIQAGLAAALPSSLVIAYADWFRERPAVACVEKAGAP